MWSLLLLFKTTASHLHSAESVRPTPYLDRQFAGGAEHFSPRFREHPLQPLFHHLREPAGPRIVSSAHKLQNWSTDPHWANQQDRLFSDEDTLTCFQLEAAGWVGPPWRHWDGQSRYHGEVLPQVRNQFITTVGLKGIQNDRGRVNGVAPGYVVSYCHVGRTKDRLHLRGEWRCLKHTARTQRLLQTKQFLHRSVNMVELSSKCIQLTIIRIHSIQQGHKHLNNENMLREEGNNVNTLKQTRTTVMMALAELQMSWMDWFHLQANMNVWIILSRCVLMGTSIGPVFLANRGDGVAYYS